MVRRVGVALAACGAVTAGVGTAIAQQGGPGAPAFAPVGSYTTGLGVESAETFAVLNNRVFVTNSLDNSLDVVDIANPKAPVLIRRIDLSPYGAGPNSVDAAGGLVAVAVEADPATDPGVVVFFTPDGRFVATAAVGALPDMLAFTPDGGRVVVANEGEPSGYGQPDSVDPEGSVSIVDVSAHGKRSWRPSVRQVGFRAFNAGGARAHELPDGIRLNGPGASVAQDVEPEYLTFDAKGRTAYVTLQEANAVAVVDLKAARVSKIVALGTKDHSLAGNGLDASDRDGGINILTWPSLHGMFMPDAIARFTVRGKSYLITANEGDARDWPGFLDESRVRDIAPGLLAFANAAELRDNTRLGRLNVSVTDGLENGVYTGLFSYGTRSATIWNASTGARVWDSGDMFEQVTAAIAPAAFNADNTGDAADNRSDNKGPEPEAVAVGTLRGRTYAFVGLERVGGFIVLDVTRPHAPRFVQWANNRIYDGVNPVGPDSGPEIIRFLPAKDSPSGRPTVVVSNEITGTVTLYETP